MVERNAAALKLIAVNLQVVQHVVQCYIELRFFRRVNLLKCAQSGRIMVDLLSIAFHLQQLFHQHLLLIYKLSG